MLPRRERALRWGAALYGAGATLALFLDTQMGGNAVRLGALFGGPVLLCALWGQAVDAQPVWAAAAGLRASPRSRFWQWSPAVRDVIKYLEDPAAKSDYFEPLRQYLATLPDQRRIEIPFTRSHWEGAEIALDTPLARGWLRQLDTGRNPIFYGGPVDQADLRELAGRERGALRGPAEREAGQELIRRARADRARPALPAAALALGGLARVRGAAAHARS